MNGSARTTLMLILEASTSTASVAVIADGRIVAEREVAMGGQADERLMPAVEGALSDARVQRTSLTCVVCGAGPGGFTGLRIAGSIAKGIAHGLHIPLYACSSALLMITGIEPALPEGRYLATTDALRGEQYVTLVFIDGLGRARAEATERCAAAELPRLARHHGATLVGPGQPVIGRPRAAGAARVFAGSDPNDPVDLAGWEPSYGRLAEAQVRWEAEHGRTLPEA